jgi:hypothetical protein
VPFGDMSFHVPTLIDVPGVERMILREQPHGRQGGVGRQIREFPFKVPPVACV